MILDANAFDLKMYYPYENYVGKFFLTWKPLIRARSEFSVDAA